MTSRQLQRVRTRDLKDATLSPAELSRRVEPHAEKTTSDGLSMDRAGNVYLTDLGCLAVGRYTCPLHAADPVSSNGAGRLSRRQPAQVGNATILATITITGSKLAHGLLTAAGWFLRPDQKAQSLTAMTPDEAAATLRERLRTAGISPPVDAERELTRLLGSAT